MPIVDYNGSGNLRYQSHQQNSRVVKSQFDERGGEHFWVQSDEDGFGICDVIPYDLDLYMKEIKTGRVYDETDYLTALGLGFIGAFEQESKYFKDYVESQAAGLCNQANIYELSDVVQPGLSTTGFFVRYLDGLDGDEPDNVIDEDVINGLKLAYDRQEQFFKNPQHYIEQAKLRN
jgi:hypothetical protein